MAAAIHSVREAGGCTGVDVSREAQLGASGRRIRGQTGMIPKERGLGRCLTSSFKSSLSIVKFTNKPRDLQIKEKRQGVLEVPQYIQSVELN